MKLQYRDLLGDGELHKIDAEVTTDHPASHYGQPVIVLPDGGALDLQSWMLLGYQVMSATSDEVEDLKKVFSNFGAMVGDPHFVTSAFGRLGGSAKSEAKTRAARKNAKKRWSKN